MQKFHGLTIATSLMLIVAAPVCRGAPASAEISVLDDGQRAKVDKEEIKRKMKELQVEEGSDSVPGDSNANCGTVEIGNNNGNVRGTLTVAPHDTTVIVTGDVFNNATCGR
jgi:hypothetical protein